ncbi:hypothetical protein Q0590_35555 [Rhodocytophaga aerolata]|uniref:Uncharacterized protein n=1 Tax=Rhodocytophaga aerolata TaxID=455078 RepID=A0ABT8RJM4_9BACT|nr:hypothetical protein [Rhodocytophaga aerolata]MDO1451644.1 hypothetical protein [Rhodocytophaga aerolata]
MRINSHKLSTIFRTRQLKGSWQWTSNGGESPFYGGIPINYQELYVDGDTLSAFNFVQGYDLKPWQIQNNVVSKNGAEIARIKQINEKRLLLIHSEGVDTLTFIENLIIPRNTFHYKNKSAFEVFMKGFEQRMEKYYLETLGIDITKLPTSDIKPVDEIISELSTNDDIGKD